MSAAVALVQTLLRIGLPLLLLNTLLAFVNPGPTPWPVFSARVAPELCAALLAAALLAWHGRPSTRALRWLAAGTVVLVIVRAVEVTSAAMFGRSLNLYWDGRHLGTMLAMNDTPWWPLAAGCVAVLLAVALLHAAVSAAWRGLQVALARPLVRRAAVVASTALLATWAVPGLFDGGARDVFAEPITPVATRQAQLLVAQLSADGSASRLTASPSFDGHLAGLGGADVLLLFSESYGVSTLDDPVQDQQLAGPRDALAAAIAASGRQVVSARVRSPTFAGGSWLAHGALLSGVDTQDPLDYEVLLSTQRPTLAKHFAAHGYRTVGWMPGLQRPWPEGRFFGFGQVVDAAGTGYAGPAFGPWRIPDQAAMALLHAQVFATPRASRAPAFVVFPTTTSHAPFRPVAPYVADWNRLTGPQPYTVEEQSHAVDEPASWRDPVPGYVQSIGYTWEWLGAYLRERAPSQLLTVVIGDHQAYAGVSGPNAAWDVPVHVISADTALLQRLKAVGFIDGLAPRGPALGRMHELTPLLLRAFATP